MAPALFASGEVLFAEVVVKATDNGRSVLFARAGLPLNAGN